MGKNRKKISGPRQSRGASQRAEQAATEEKKEKPEKKAVRRYSSARAVAKAVFKKHDPADIVNGLLGDEDTKNASVKARLWERLVEYRYGKPGTGDTARAGELPVRIIVDLPGPEREREAAAGEDTEESAPEE